jgi:hypothetical protein
LDEISVFPLKGVEMNKIIIELKMGNKNTGKSAGMLLADSHHRTAVESVQKLCQTLNGMSETWIKQAVIAKIEALQTIENISLGMIETVKTESNCWQEMFQHYLKIQAMSQLILLALLLWLASTVHVATFQLQPEVYSVLNWINSLWDSLNWYAIKIVLFFGLFLVISFNLFIRDGEKEFHFFFELVNLKMKELIDLEKKETINHVILLHTNGVNAFLQSDPENLSIFKVGNKANYLQYDWGDKGWIVCKLNENGYTFDGYSHYESTSRELRMEKYIKPFPKNSNQ